MKSPFFNRILLVPAIMGLLALSLPAQAQPAHGGGRFARERAAGAQRQAMPRRDEVEAQRNPDVRVVDDDRRRGLTLEQRQQLRRDIGEAGRDIYRPGHKSRRFQRREQ